MSERENRGVLLLYKKLGETPSQSLLRFKAENAKYAKTSLTYAGRLDPMAEGLLLVLSGDSIKEKDKYLGLQKTYEFEILWGFETDTLDTLGRVVKSGKCKVKSKDLEIQLNKSIGKFEQSYPAYSSKPVSGKPMFQWTREGKFGEVNIPLHEVEIFRVSFISRRIVSGAELLKDIIAQVSLVSGDFRQKEILERWAEVLASDEEVEFTIDRISITVSSGFYVRQFVSDVATAFKTSATTFHIKRVKIGEYSVETV